MYIGVYIYFYRWINIYVCIYEYIYIYIFINVRGCAQVGLKLALPAYIRIDTQA